MISAVFKFRSYTISLLKVPKGHNSNKNIDGLNVIVSLWEVAVDSRLSKANVRY